MSFIYAEKYYSDTLRKNSISIWSDTRIGLGEGTKANFSETQIDLIKNYGIVKSTICSRDLCISFAGNNIRYAAELFSTLNKKGTFDFKCVTDLAYEIHMNATSKDDVEFIIAYYSEGDFYIDCIKERTKYSNRHSAWIGSETAFSSLQKFRLDNKKESENVDKYTALAFANVVEGCGDITVGGIPIKVTYNYENNSFEYAWIKSINSTKEHAVKHGDDISFFTSARDGGFVYEILPVSIQDAMIKIEQIKHMILYSRQYRISGKEADNEHAFGLMLPMTVIENGKGDIVRL